jgi:hypothetical protein
MTLRYLIASGLLAAVTVAPVTADAGQGSLQVSAQVVRSCRVTSEQPQVSVNCGSRPQTLHVTYDQAQGVPQSVSAPTAVAPATARTVTIHF